MSSFSLAHGVGITAACVAFFALFFTEDVEGDDESLFDKYDKDDDGALSAAEVRAVRKDFKAGLLTKIQMKTLTGSSGTNMKLLIVAGVGTALVTALILLILFIFGPRIWANISGLFAPKARDTAHEEPKVMAPTQPVTVAERSAPTPEGPKALEVKIHSASKLMPRMHFTTDKPYVSVSSLAGHQDTAAATIGKNDHHHQFVNVEWEERLVIGSKEHPWTSQDTLEFAIRSNGLFNSKLMGKGHLTGSQLASGRWSGEIDITGPSLPDDHPGKLSVTVAAVPADLPKNWHVATDAVGQIYYYNEGTGKSQWNAPTTGAN